ncbi:MAG: ribonuclease J, partial [Deltaproteobacteria bacterium]|nr:ribonuclease J [Deltaproteobacteria bacterium]
PMSVLIRMAMDSHKHLKIDKGDTVILSSKFIPGNEKAISNMMNHLYRRGAEVIYEKVSEVHVSGHGSQEELKAMLNMTKPKCFVPVHGEYRHLVRHARLAMKTGVKEENVVVAEDGNVIELTKDGIAINGEVDSGRVFVDGKGVGDVGDMVLKDRRHLSRDGMVMALIALDSKTGDVLYGPDIVTRGLIFEEESEHLLDGAREAVEIALMEANKEVKTDTAVLTEEVRLALRRFFNKSLERKPVILPMVVEV